jgi:hypothetical protein
MPCLVGCLALSAPRFAIILVALFSNYLGRAYESALWPFIGAASILSSLLGFVVYLLLKA